MSEESTTLECRQCDTNTAEPEAAKVIVVVEAPVGDRSPVERRYLAHEADDHRDYGFLRIRRDGRPVASYAQGAWLSAREDGALVPDVTLRKLSIAMEALQAVASIVLEADDKRRVPVRVARDALELIAELDL
jgi:hypothetical protein